MITASHLDELREINSKEAEKKNNEETIYNCASVGDSNHAGTTEGDFAY